MTNTKHSSECGGRAPVDRLRAGLYLAAIACATCTAAAVSQDVGEIGIRPLSPGAGDSVLATFSGVWPNDCPPKFARNVEFDGRDVTLSVSSTAEDPPATNCNPTPTEYRTTLTIGVVEESGPYDLELLLVDTPFLPTSLGTVSFDVGPANLVRMELPDAPNGSEPGIALVYGQWLEGCVPDALRVEMSSGIEDLYLVSELPGTDCGTEYVPFALSVALPVLPEGEKPVEYLVFDDLVGVPRAVGMLDVGPPITKPLLNQERFEVAVTYDGLNVAKVAPGSTGDTALFTFFDPDNLEMQVKVLDGCGINGHYWVFGAASTDLAFTIQVTDTETDALREYVNPAGQAARAINDTSAFPCGS